MITLSMQAAKTALTCMISQLYQISLSQSDVNAFLQSNYCATLVAHWGLLLPYRKCIALPVNMYAVRFVKVICISLDYRMYGVFQVVLTLKNF